ncbi:hypothetical protein B0H13DRAFT_2464854 [Mycena leptocephala]|nr:hypothetical protein B0H13DRAFT_2464854 [Mycena leptocephala]
MDPAVSFNLNVTLGAYQIGILLSYVLFGVTTTQMYIYYTRFPNDPLKLKSLVAFVWACEFAHALCIGHNLYVWTISSYGHPERVLGRAPDSFGVSIFLSGVIAVCVPAFFSFRIYTLSKQLYIPVLTWTMVFLRLLGTTVLFVATFQMKSLLASIAQWEWLTTATLSVGMANDLTIAASLVLILHKQRHNGLKRTAVLVDKLILWTLETGMLTSPLDGYFRCSSTHIFKLVLSESELQGDAPRNGRAFFVDFAATFDDAGGAFEALSQCKDLNGEPWWDRAPPKLSRPSRKVYEREGAPYILGGRSAPPRAFSCTDHCARQRRRPIACLMWSQRPAKARVSVRRRLPLYPPPSASTGLNNNGVWRPKSLSQTFQDGASSVNNALASLRAEVHELKRETHAQFESNQLAISAVSKSVSTLHSTVDSLHTRLSNHASAFLIQSAEQATRAQLVQVQMIMAQHQNTMRFGDADHYDEAKAEYNRLYEEQKTLMKNLSRSAGQAIAMLGGTLGSSIAPPVTPPGIEIRSRSSSPSPESTHKKRKSSNRPDDDSLMTEKPATSVRVSLPLNFPVLIATRDTSSVKSMKCADTTQASSRVSPGRGFHGVLSFAGVDVSPRCDERVLPSRKKSVYSLDTQYESPPLLLLILILLSVANFALAAGPRANSGFSSYALNMNGLGGPGKISHVNSVISQRNPHSFVITETKTNEKLSSKLPREYNIFEEDAIPLSHAKGHKWGVAVGIRKDVQISQRVQITKASLKGRVLAIDVILPTDSGRGFVHRVIGVYAPWDPGINNVDPNARDFWGDLTIFCNETLTSWSISGDLNATVTSSERAADKSDARVQFLRFLKEAKAHDLWSDIPDRNRQTCWTSKARGSGGGGNIIDRIVSSKSQLIDSEIGVADRYTDFVPSTDHRAVVGKLIYAPPSSSYGNYMVFPEAAQVFNQPRIKYPFKSEKHLFEVFKNAVDERIKAEAVHLSPVTDDFSFTKRYDALSKIILPCAEEIFGRTSRYKKSHLVTSPKIQAMVASMRSVGGAIRHVKSGFKTAIAFKSLNALKHYEAEYCQTSISASANFCEYLVSVRRQLHKDLYAEKMAEIFSRAKLQDRNRMIAALRGGSTKKLVAAGYFVPLPTSISACDDPDKLLSDPEEVMEETRQYFSKLYGRLPPVTVPKPWMETPSVVAVRDRTLSFGRGPHLSSNSVRFYGEETRNLLPGQTAGRNLHNYMVMNSRFPGT